VASVDSLTFGGSSRPGEQVTLTVRYTADAPVTAGNVTTDLVDGAGNVTASAQAPVPVSAVRVTDDTGRTWALESDDGTTAVFTAVA
jgi:hypothetical protein